MANLVRFGSQKKKNPIREINICNDCGIARVYLRVDGIEERTLSETESYAIPCGSYDLHELLKLISIQAPIPVDLSYNINRECLDIVISESNYSSLIIYGPNYEQIQPTSGDCRAGRLVTVDLVVNYPIWISGPEDPKQIPFSSSTPVAPINPTKITIAFVMPAGNVYIINAKETPPPGSGSGGEAPPIGDGEIIVTPDEI